jgi:hypothetical protein
MLTRVGDGTRFVSWRLRRLLPAPRTEAHGEVRSSSRARFLWPAKQAHHPPIAIPAVIQRPRPLLERTIPVRVGLSARHSVRITSKIPPSPQSQGGRERTTGVGMRACLLPPGDGSNGTGRLSS